MLHDAAKRGDVEIPVFCYEPKLGDPVGACRMCLVEIEGMPKLQTSCSTPVRDGMVVHTMTDQVKHAQSAVVEFLLVNHPLDCPVCDKGGECPLQDITQGWGPGKSRVIDEKRHFQKPVELSPLIAIDRERCILCYRCVRFSQEVAEDSQLQLLERGDRSFVGTFDDRPYVAPFHGNITELCPVGALTSYTYRFRARPWDIEQAGSVCTLCPSQCNVSFTVRDEQVKRVLGRDNAEVDDGWLCDRGRYGFEMFEAEERVDGPRLKGGAATDWETAIAAAAAGLRAGRRRNRGDRRRRLQRGGLPGPAHPARGARLAARRFAPRARPLPRGAGPALPADPHGPRAGHRRRRRDPRRRHRPPAQLPDPRPPHPQGDPPQRRQARRRHRPPHPPRRRRRRRSARYAPSGRHSLPLRAGRLPATPQRRRRPAPTWPRPCATRRASWSSGATGSPVRASGATAALLDVASALDLAEQGRLRPARDPRRDQRPRPARGRLPPGRRPGPRRDRRGKGHRGDPRRPGVGRAEVPAPLRRRPDPRLPRHRRLGRPRSAPPTSSSPSRCSRTRRPPRPTSSSPSRPTPRKTARSPTPTAASSGSGRAPPTRETSAPTGRVLTELSAALGHDTGIASQPSAFAAVDRGRSLLRRASPTPT